MSESLPSVRDELLTRVSYGRMTPDEAEAEAKRLDLRPFARMPDPGAFDPMAEANWTLPMAVSWIARRTVDAVRETWPAYREGCWHWIWKRWRNGPDGEIHEGWFLEQWSFPTLLLIELSEIMRRVEDQPMSSTSLMTVREARESLWTALGEGMLPATAVPRLGGARMTIPPEEWPGLSPKESDHRDELSRGGPGLAYVDMLVPTKAVTHLWGPRRASTASLPALIRPEGYGYMPLSSAAQWIATEGGTRVFDPADEAIWREAFDKLLGAAASDKVRVVGMKDGTNEPVPGHKFAGIVVDYPYSEAPLDVIMGGAVYLRCYPYLDEEHWRKAFHDALVSRGRDHWTHLQVERGDVRELWPFALAAPNRSGAPGRPTSMYLVEQELERRGTEKQLEDSIRQQAEVLASWFGATYSDKAPLTAKTIRNKIGPQFRRLRGDAGN